MTTKIQEAQTAFEAVAERFADPERARRTLTAAAELRTGLRCDVDVRSHRITIDEPKGIGGTDAGASPVEHVLAALVACQAMTYRMWAAKLGLALESVRVECDGDLDLRGLFGLDEDARAGYSALRLRVRLQGPETPERYREFADVVDRHCPVLDIVAGVPVERVVVDDV